MTYDDSEARQLGLERTTRELTDEVRVVSSQLADVAELRLAQQRTRRTIGSVVLGGIALLLVATAIAATLLLMRVNALIEDRRESVRAACIARNQETDNVRERFATLAMQDARNERVWTELAKVYSPSAVDCNNI